VDDGSRDGTASVVQGYRGSVKYLRQENRGEPAARNLGIRNARGSYIAFLDGDDLWTPDKLAVQMEYFDKNQSCDLVYSDMKTFDDEGVIEESVKKRFNIIFPRGNIFRQLFRETLFGSGSVVLRKRCFETIGFFDETLLVGSDYEMWLRIARRFEVGYIDRPLLMYRQHPTMATRSLGRVLQHGMPWEVVVLKRTLELHPGIIEELGMSAINQRLSKPYACMGHTFLQQQNHLNARGMFREALAHWPTNLQYRLFYLATFTRPYHLAGIRKLYGSIFKLCAGTKRRGEGLPLSTAS
jgi:glycosyltransferase involved in cell wall biosynthesis